MCDLEVEVGRAINSVGRICGALIAVGACSVKVGL